MKKILVLLVLIAAALAGCKFLQGDTAEPPVKPKMIPRDAAKNSLEGMKEYYIGFETPVQTVPEWVERYDTYEGVFLQKLGEYRALLIGMGEEFTGGYAVNVDKVEKKEDKWVVRVSFREPGQGEISTQQINYPFEVVTIIDDGKPIEVFKVKDQAVDTPMQVIEIPQGKNLPASMNFLVITPLAEEKISSPLLIKGKARVFEANFHVSLRAGVKTLSEKTVMADQGAPGWGDFEAQLPFNRPDSIVGEIVFSYEHAETGGMIEELVIPVKFNQ